MASGSALIFHGRNEFLDYLESHARPTTQMSAHVLGQSDWVLVECCQRSVLSAGAERQSNISFAVCLKAGLARS